MGFSIKFNWVLQIAIGDALQIGKHYPFSKKGNRVFPLGAPIDLIDLRRNAIARIKVIHFTNCHNQTTGEFEVIKIYTDDEKIMLTRYWQESV